jgi:predicted ATPase/transcriptional regulator with XRE-family HTH domain
MNDGTSFGAWLRQKRKSLDLTQEALADQIGCSKDTVRKIELGIRRPSRQVAELLAQRFNVPPQQQQAFMLFARGSGGNANLYIQPISQAITNTSLRLSANPPNNLPAAPTPFIGRGKEIEKLLFLIMREGVRTVTLMGPGGIGKTRLALRVAEKLLVQEDFEDGVFFVPLASIRDPDLLVPAISHVLGVREVGNQPLLDSLKHHLHGKQILLLLDNFEQIIAASLTVAELVSASAGLKVLVTSRQLLGLQSEYTFPVPALDMPVTQAKYHEPLELLTQYEAVRLFIERSIAASPDFEVTNDNAPAVAEICVRLDGLPLAIELAAARVTVLPPQAMLSRLQDRLKLLTGGAQDLPARQQTLRNTIEWSYDLLTAGEKQLFRRLAVFRGGCTLECLERVCNYDGQLQVEILDGLDSLIGKSLLRQTEGRNREPRFWMLETIHELAREKLEESGEAEALEREHALHFMGLAEEAEPQIRGAKQVEWLERLDDEHDNLRAAVAWVRREVGQETESRAEWATEGSLAVEAVDIGLRLVGALQRFWANRGYYSEGRQQIRSIVDVDTAQGGPIERQVARGKALLGAQLLAHRQGEIKESYALAEEALRLFRAAGDKQDIARALLAMAASTRDADEQLRLLEESQPLLEETGETWDLARLYYRYGQYAMFSQGDFTAAKLYFERCLVLGEQAGDPAMIALCLLDLGNVARFRLELDSAKSSYERSLVYSRQVRDKWAIGLALTNSTDIAWILGDYSLVRPFSEEARELFQEIGDPGNAAGALLDLGRIALIEGDTNEARSLLERCLHESSIEPNPNGWLEVLALRYLGHVARRQGNPGEAADLYKRSLSVDLQVNRPIKCWLLAGTFAALGLLTVEAQEIERAIRLLAIAQSLTEASGQLMYYDERGEYEQSLAATRAWLVDDAAWQAIWEQGRATSLEQAIVYALQES